MGMPKALAYPTSHSHRGFSPVIRRLLIKGLGTVSTVSRLRKFLVQDKPLKRFEVLRQPLITRLKPGENETSCCTISEARYVSGLQLSMKV
jgi:hypothetical protein